MSSQSINQGYVSHSHHASCCVCRESLKLELYNTVNNAIVVYRIYTDCNDQYLIVYLSM